MKKDAMLDVDNYALMPIWYGVSRRMSRSFDNKTQIKKRCKNDARRTRYAAVMDSKGAKLKDSIEGEVIYMEQDKDPWFKDQEPIPMTV